MIDLAQAHLLAIKREAPGLEVYNVGDDAGFTNREVIQSAERVTGRKINIIEQGRAPVIRWQSSPVRIRFAANWRWNPRHAALDTIIESAWKWLAAYSKWV